MTQDEIIWQNEVLEMARQAGFEEQFTRPQDAIVRKGIALSGEFKGYKVNNAVLETFAKLVVAKAFPHGVDAEWIARRTKYAVEQERANNALLCYQQRKHWDALACSDAIRAGIRARGEQHEQQ
jgi:hypothetical protein